MSQQHPDPREPFPQPQQPPSRQEVRAYAAADKAHRKAMRPWFKKKRFILPLALAALIVLMIALNSGKDPAPTAGQPASSSQPQQKAPAGKAPATKAPASKPTSSLTSEQQQAVGEAQDYLNTMAFSRKGLIRQLSSDAGSGYSKKDATVAVDSLTVDYNEQAKKAAKEYLSSMHFSRKNLIRQLESDAGSGFTHAQAVYGAERAL